MFFLTGGLWGWEASKTKAGLWGWDGDAGEGRVPEHLHVAEPVLTLTASL